MDLDLPYQQSRLIEAIVCSRPHKVRIHGSSSTTSSRRQTVPSAGQRGRLFAGASTFVSEKSNQRLARPSNLVSLQRWVKFSKSGQFIFCGIAMRKADGR
ncbi:hypothetical protein VTO42DRAFT_7995 [Malbranchea cinnamomea]